jgi:hypothetical protein
VKRVRGRVGGAALHSEQAFELQIVLTELLEFVSGLPQFRMFGKSSGCGPELGSQRTWLRCNAEKGLKRLVIDLGEREKLVRLKLALARLDRDERRAGDAEMFGRAFLRERAILSRAF